MDTMIGAVDANTAPDVIERFAYHATSARIELNIAPNERFHSDEKWRVAMDDKVHVIDAIDDVARVRQIGLSSGFVLPDDPFVRMATLNVNRSLFAPLSMPEADAAALISVAKDLVAIAAGYDSGEITFDRSGFGAKISSFDVSIAGVTKQSGDPLADILGYQPDGDFIKRKRALDALARLDFTKRKPYIVFTADNPTSTVGAILCWQRMRDAAGYRITRADSFDPTMAPRSTMYTNEQAAKSTETLRSNAVFASAISFYDWLKDGDYFAFEDKDFQRDRVYSYVVEAYQLKASSVLKPFDVPTRSLYLSPVQLKALDETGRQPYAMLSAIVYGDERYDWIVAGCNVTNSIRLNDGAARRLGFIGATAADIVARAQSGALVVPNDAAAFEKTINDLVMSYGVSQTIISVLDGIGATSFVTGKDDPFGFQPSVQSVQSVTGGLAKILSAIDPSTAIVDPRALSAGLSAGSGMSIGTNSAEQRAEIAELDQRLMDLTTFDGISRFMRFIRQLYDVLPSFFLA